MTQNKRVYLFLCTVSPALLFWLAWPPRDLFFLSFFALVPLFLLEQETRGKKGSSALIYLALLCWNVVISWWVGYAELYASIFMLFANSWLMYLPWLGYRKAQNILSKNKAILVFVSLWLSFEYLHLNWQIAWPWFTLGNIFSKHNEVVQWYEITGALGGSLWVLLANVSLYKCLPFIKKAWWKPTTIIVLPMLISIPFFLSHQRNDNHQSHGVQETLIVQPNIDPYLKFDESTEIKNLKMMLSLAEQELSDSTAYIIFPETAIVEYVDEKTPNRFESIRIIKKFVREHPQIHLIAGISTYKFYADGEVKSSTARKTESGDFYESYNTAIEVNKNGDIDFYHKRKLVPGAEIMPYPQFFSFLDFLAVDLGGISGSLGSDQEAKVFEAAQKPDLAPLICYESVFPGLVAEFCRKGAEILLVITNDGWWENTDGYKQHMYYASLRAIENRREVLRSANTGISCRINKLGQIQQRTDWWKPDVLRVNVKAYDSLTFYAKYGDYIGRFASFLGGFFLLGMFVKRKT